MNEQELDEEEKCRKAPTGTELFQHSGASGLTSGVFGWCGGM